jgi:hypothetical protein
MISRSPSSLGQVRLAPLGKSDTTAGNASFKQTAICHVCGIETTRSRLPPHQRLCIRQLISKCKPRPTLAEVSGTSTHPCVRCKSYRQK